MDPTLKKFLSQSEYQNLETITIMSVKRFSEIEGEDIEYLVIFQSYTEAMGYVQEHELGASEGWEIVFSPSMDQMEDEFTWGTED